MLYLQRTFESTTENICSFEFASIKCNSGMSSTLQKVPKYRVSHIKWNFSFPQISDKNGVNHGQGVYVWIHQGRTLAWVSLSIYYRIKHVGECEGTQFKVLLLPFSADDNRQKCQESCYWQHADPQDRRVGVSAGNWRGKQKAWINTNASLNSLNHNQIRRCEETGP